MSGPLYRLSGRYRGQLEHRGRRAPARGSTRRLTIQHGAELLLTCSLTMEGTGGRPRRQADWVLLCGGAVHHAGARCVASVCFCTAENCWAQSSTVSPNSQAWETRASRKLTLSTSLLSTRQSHRWRSWTTPVDIASPRLQPRVGTTLVHLMPWLGVLVGQPWHAAQRRLGPPHCKLWPRKRPSVYRLWTGDEDNSSKWRRFAGTSALQPHSPPGECQRTP